MVEGPSTTDSAGRAHRGWAFVALGALAVATVLAVVVTLKSFGALVTLVAGVLVVVVGGWYVVTRRGGARIIALVVLVAGVALAVVGLLAVDVRWEAVLGLAILVSVAVGAARLALGRTKRAVATSTREAPPAPRPSHPVLLMNPKSGGGKAVKFELERECRERGIEPVVLGPGDDLLELAEDAVARGADAIGMAGGDGSQALVATVAVKHDLPHVVIPAGTRNHLALDLGLDRDDVVGALDAFIDGVERRVDLATLNGRVFVNNASLGLYAKIVQSPEYRDAKLKTAGAMLPDLLGPDADPLDLRFTGPDGAERPTAHMILVSNNPYQLDELGGRGTRERMDRGDLGIAALTVTSARDVQQLIALDAVGQVGRFPGWLEWTSASFEIRSDGPVEVGVDGEALTLEPPLVFESRPSVLRVRLPRHAIGASPAAMRVSRSSVSELLELAWGRTHS